MPSDVIDRLRGVKSSQAIKVPCRVATTENITLSGLQTIDGVTLVENDRVLVKDQSTASENGIYECDTGAWSRTADFDGSGDVVNGTRVYVTDGSTNRGLFAVRSSNPVTINTSSIQFVSSIVADSSDGERVNILTYFPAIIDLNAIANGTSTTDLSSYINQAIEGLSEAGGGKIWFPEGRYVVGDTIISRQNVICEAQFPLARIYLADGANCNITDSYDFDAMYAAQDFDTTDRADFTQDYGWDGFVFDGNWENQDTGTLLYGVRMYGRRITLKNSIIFNVAGVGLHTALFGTHNSPYDYTKGKTPAGIQNVEIIRTLDEAWIYEGPSDTPIDSVVTNECGDPDNDGTTPQTSRHVGSGPVHSVYWNAWGEAGYMNLNGARFGHLLYVTSGQRINIDNLIVAGGWGGFYAESNAFGVIDKLLAQSIDKGWSATAKPYVEVATDDIIFNGVTIRRVTGADNGGYGIKDSGGCQWGIIRSRQAPANLGTLFYTDASYPTIELLDATGCAVGLHTASGCSFIDFHLSFNNVDLVWQNDVQNICGKWVLTGTLGSGNTLTSGVLSGTVANRTSLKRAVVAYLDASGTLQTNIDIGNTGIAGAATVDIGSGTTGRDIVITGSGATISSFGTAPVGVFRSVYFEDINDLTHHSTQLAIPGGNVTTAAGDRLGALSLGSGNWRVVWYQRADGKARIAPAFSEVTGKPTTIAGYGITDGWRILAKSGVQFSHTGNTSETVAATIQLPAGAMGPNGALRVTLLAATNTNSANNKIYRARLGGVSGSQFISVTIGTSFLSGAIQRTIFNRNSQSSQGGITSGGANSFTNVNAAPFTSSVDTSVNQDIVLSVQLADGAETIYLEGYIIEVAYGA